ELASTVVAAGTAAERQATENKMAARRAMAPAMAAEAAGYYGGRDRLADHDLVGLPAAEQAKALPAAPALQGKTEAEALAYLKDQKARRDGLQARIQVLTKQREEILSASSPTDSSHHTVLAALMP